MHGIHGPRLGSPRTSSCFQDSSRIADFDNIKEEDYSFAGMAHIFDQHINSAVTCISFARGSRSQIALGSADGSVSICSCLGPFSIKIYHYIMVLNTIT